MGRYGALVRPVAHRELAQLLACDVRPRRRPVSIGEVVAPLPVDHGLESLRVRLVDRIPDPIVLGSVRREREAEVPSDCDLARVTLARDLVADGLRRVRHSVTPSAVIRPASSAALLTAARESDSSLI